MSTGAAQWCLKPEGELEEVEADHGASPNRQVGKALCQTDYMHRTWKKQSTLPWMSRREDSCVARIRLHGASLAEEAGI